jgi:hypothetical protein
LNAQCADAHEPVMNTAFSLLKSPENWQIPLVLPYLFAACLLAHRDPHSPPQSRKTASSRQAVTYAGPPPSAIAPGGIELRAAQLFRVFCREQVRGRTVAPGSKAAS